MSSQPSGATRVVAVTVALVIAVTVTLAVAAVIDPGWVGDRLHADFFPPDNSRVGTNILASAVQWLIVAVVAALVYPPVHRFIMAELDRVHSKVDHQIDLLHHVIKHSDNLPDHDADGRPWLDRRPPRGRA